MNIINKEQEKTLKIFLRNYVIDRNSGNSYNWSWKDKVLFHKFYLLELIDDPVLTKEEEYNYFDMGTPCFPGIIKERLLNDYFDCINDDYLEN